MSLTIAVPRGALFGEALDLLDRLDVDTSEIRANDRKLVFPEVGVITMRPSDIPAYVEHGAADVQPRDLDLAATAPNVGYDTGCCNYSCESWSDYVVGWDHGRPT